MKGMRMTAAALVATALFTTASAQLIYETGFESPTYSLGDLAGQDDWMVTPANATGTVQNTVVHGGAQALELVDGASFGRAQRSVVSTITQPVLMASFAMYFGNDWVGPMEADRFEAQVRLEVSGAKAGVYGIEFGFVKAPSGGYEGVPGDSAALFIEVGSESAMMASMYSVVDIATYAGSWHLYDLSYDNTADLVTLWVDGVWRGQLTVTEDVTDISNVQLQNQRWGTNPQNSAPLYFDDLNVAQAVPEPATMIALAVGAAGVLARRRRR